MDQKICERHQMPITRVEPYSGVEFCELCIEEAVEQKWMCIELEALDELELVLEKARLAEPNKEE